MKFLKNKKTLDSKHLVNIVNGSFFYNGLVKKHFVYIIFCALLLVFHIGNRYKCEQQLKDIAKLEKENTDLRYQSVTTTAELLSISRQSTVSRLVKERKLGLRGSIKAPQRIYIED